MDQVILVDKDDNELGFEEKMAAHQHGGKLHRAFSIFVFNKNGETLLQRRALTKYHSAGLWTNTCCSHPRPGETLDHAVHRRLVEEMGFDTTLREVHKFVYTAPFANGLTEHELDHVFVGQYEGTMTVNPEEVDSYKWITMAALKEDVAANPDQYTEWFKIILENVDF